MSWYVYWPGMNATSTGHSDFDKAVEAAEHMLRNSGQRGRVADTILSDDEFDEIQVTHFGKKQEEKAKQRAAKSLRACMEAITAFRGITELNPITIATAEDCERFQLAAMKLPKNWRSKYPNSRKDSPTLSANTVFKWTVALRAAWERANVNAGNKCVRSVVPKEKLLTENPWNQFTGIEKSKRPIRQFGPQELLSFLDYSEDKWSGITVATLMAKVLVWSACRKEEVSELRWDGLRQVGDEYHFEIIGKHGVERWFRIPTPLFQELEAIKIENAFVFASYNDQLRSFHANGSRPWLANKVADEFKPANLGDWFYERVAGWAEAEGIDSACIHIFRKTTLQYARSGEDVNKQVAEDAGVSVGVMMTHYAKETDPEMRQKSNRTFRRIAGSLTPEVAMRFGYFADDLDSLQQRLNQAYSAQDFDLISRIAAEIAKQKKQGG